MAIEIYIYNLLDLGGNVERVQPMTEAEAKEANEKLHNENPRLLRWSKSVNQKTGYEKSNNKNDNNKGSEI